MAQRTNLWRFVELREIASAAEGGNSRKPDAPYSLPDSGSRRSRSCLTISMLKEPPTEGAPAGLQNSSCGENSWAKTATADREPRTLHGVR